MPGSFMVEVGDMNPEIQESVDAIRAVCGEFKPDCGIIFGTGLTSLADDVTNPCHIAYADIPHFAQPTVETHAGELILGELEGKSIIAMRGRFHYYEGYSMKQITHPVRVMHAMGAETLFVSNACGGMNPDFEVGSICILDDHINLLGDNPLIGPNEDDAGPRFPDMSEPYDAELQALAHKVAAAHGVTTNKAVYVAVPGPNLETRAEYRFLRIIGADLVGMSTVPEVITAVHRGMRCVGFSIITDACLPDSLVPVTVDEIIATSKRAEPHLNNIVKGMLQEL